MGGEGQALSLDVKTVSREEELDNKLDSAVASGQDRDGKSSVEMEHPGVVGERVAPLAEDGHICCETLFLGSESSSSDSFAHE